MQSTLVTSLLLQEVIKKGQKKRAGNVYKLLSKSMNMNLEDCVSSPPTKSFISKGTAVLGKAARMATGVRCVRTKNMGDRTVWPWSVFAA